MKTFIVIPAFNEAASITAVVSQVFRFSSRVVVVDDGSTDQTACRVPAPAIVLRHPINLGQGAALQTGLEYARTHQADAVVTYDADGQFNPADLPKFITPLEKNLCDVVLGSRFLGRAPGLPLSKLLTLKTGVLFTHLFSNLSVTDAHNGFRSFNRTAINHLSITQNRMAHASEILHQLSFYGLRFLEVPVTIRYNPLTPSQSSLNALNIFIDLLDI